MDLWAFFQWNKLLFKNIVCPEKLKKKKFEKKMQLKYYLLLFIQGNMTSTK